MQGNEGVTTRLPIGERVRLKGEGMHKGGDGFGLAVQVAKSKLLLRPAADGGGLKIERVLGGSEGFVVALQIFEHDTSFVAPDVGDAGVYGEGAIVGSEGLFMEIENIEHAALVGPRFGVLWINRKDVLIQGKRLVQFVPLGEQVAELA